MDNKEIAKEKIEMLRGLRQVRQFSPRQVPDDVVEDILQVARWTGSGMNRQPWEFVLVRNRETLQQIAQAENGGSYIPGANFAILIIMAGESKEIETYDEGRLTERLMLAAAAHGVAAGIWWFKDGGKAARQLLGIPEDKPVRTAVAFGYPSETPAQRRPGASGGRKPLSEIVHEERY